ncbi:hypothetical protein L207DRAFT_582488 [Hyaloscypha variabilis F]|uniref:Uncharacterized protein n=1 Tax=Hyaloscypha variabilis (strain UAMH 11265 / GT02V1 / F) TaxID=1149755 RepID=A0A2J6RP33_HYAVF|nr:hypothetical protein L207DRAFT_582488 [Hyaloscypha variabilis F]
MVSYLDLKDVATTPDGDPGVWGRIQRIADLGTAAILEKGTALHFVMSLGKSYLMLCRVLDSVRKIRHDGFGKDFFTILIYRGSTEVCDENVAELVAIGKQQIDSFLATIGGAIRRVVDKLDLSHTFPEKTTVIASSVILEDILPACEILLEDFGTPIRRPPTPPPARDVLILCRTLAFMLDLGLVSYIGCHASRFDTDSIGRDCSDTTVTPPGGGKIGFQFSLMKLNCLDGFLNHQPVWVFRPLWATSETTTEPVSVLTSVMALADTWGPIWEIPAGEDHPDFIKQINVGTGFICGNGTHSPTNNTVSCHWYPTPGTRNLLRPEVQFLIPRDAKLLIGAASHSILQANESCPFTLDDLERDFGLNMTPLGTKPSVWSTSERQGGFSVSQYGVGITAKGIQKKLPCTTQKQAIWNKWKFQAKRANPNILNSYLGVEISNCTGNARRVKLRDLFTMPPIQNVLMYQFPDWLCDTGFGESLQAAFSNENDEDIVRVWTDYWSVRDQMAEIVCYALELLEKTGNDAGTFNAVFLNHLLERSMPLDLRLNSWAGFLEDSHLTAVYAIVNEVCFDGGELGHNLATCKSSRSATSAFTVFETMIAVPPDQTNSGRVCIDQRGYLQRVSSPDERVPLVTWELGRIRELGGRVGRILGSGPSQKPGLEVQNEKQLGGEHGCVLVKSTKLSFGGLPARAPASTMAVVAPKIPLVVDPSQSSPIRAVEQKVGDIQVTVPVQDQLLRSSTI